MTSTSTSVLVSLAAAMGWKSLLALCFMGLLRAASHIFFLGFVATKKQLAGVFKVCEKLHVLLEIAMMDEQDFGAETWAIQLLWKSIFEMEIEKRFICIFWSFGDETNCCQCPSELVPSLNKECNYITIGMSLWERRRMKDVGSHSGWLVAWVEEERWLREMLHTQRGQHELVASYCLVEVRHAPNRKSARLPDVWLLQQGEVLSRSSSLSKVPQVFSSTPFFFAFLRVALTIQWLVVFCKMATF